MMNEKEQTFVEMINRNQRLIYKLCFMYANDNDTLSDYYQECMLNLWRSMDRFKEQSKESTWIYRIVLNTCVTFLRREKRKPTTIPLNPDVNLFDSGEHLQNIRQLYQLINQLEAIEKAIILLYLDEKSYEEIASIIGIKANYVGVRVSRIKEKLKLLSNA